MFAALAQHLRTALVPLDVDATHGTLLDGHVRVAVGAGPAQQGRDAGETSGMQLMGAHCMKPRRSQEFPGSV